MKRHKHKKQNRANSQIDIQSQLQQLSLFVTQAQSRDRVI